MKQPDILKEALNLPPEARASLAGSLLDSLDQGVDDNADSTWQEEVARRLAELDSGSVKPIPWSEARRKITSK
jgi:putative addiction module component (TIGR02574 family)